MEMESKQFRSMTEERRIVIPKGRERRHGKSKGRMKRKGFMVSTSRDSSTRSDGNCIQIFT